MRPSASQSSPAAATPIERSAHVDPGDRKGGSSRLAAWAFPLAVAGILSSGAILFATLVPVPHRIPESVTISVAEGGLCKGGPNITTPRDGTFEFSWMTNDTMPGGSLSFEPNTGLTVYTGDGTQGTGDVQVLSGEVYSFFFCGSAKEYVQISGAITYGAPLV
jgi:hypothetical protein